jgi:hypothetical protein
VNQGVAAWIAGLATIGGRLGERALDAPRRYPREAVAASAWPNRVPRKADLGFHKPDVSMRSASPAGERVRIEAEALGIEPAGGHRLELDGEQLEVPPCLLGGRVVGEAIRPDLLGGEVRGRLLS